VNTIISQHELLSPPSMKNQGDFQYSEQSS
jgi:hypothetical protein